MLRNCSTPGASAKWNENDVMSGMYVSCTGAATRMRCHSFSGLVSRSDSNFGHGAFSTCQ